MMKNENMEYLKRVREEIEEYYNVFENEEGEEVSLYDYCSTEVLDYEITIDSQLNFSSCKVYITLGGPTIWIDTANRSIELRWGGEDASLYLDSDICDEIDSYFEEIYNCR